MKLSARWGRDAVAWMGLHVAVAVRLDGPQLISGAL